MQGQYARSGSVPGPPCDDIDYLVNDMFRLFDSHIPGNSQEWSS